KANPEILTMPLSLGPEDVNPLILRRVLGIWAGREQRWEHLQTYIPKVEEARDWHAAESQKRDVVIADLQQQLAAAERRQAGQNAWLRRGKKARDWDVAESKPQTGVIATQEPPPEETLAAALASREKRIRELETSMSWRITAPLRRMGGIFGRLTGRPKSAPTEKN